MKEKLSLGPTPHDESCVQFGHDDYSKNSHLECQAFVDQLRRENGPEPSGSRFLIMLSPYTDVVIEFDQNNEEAVEYALLVESRSPGNWDSKSILFLQRNSYPFRVSQIQPS